MMADMTQEEIDLADAEADAIEIVEEMIAAAEEEIGRPLDDEERDSLIDEFLKGLDDAIDDEDESEEPEGAIAGKVGPPAVVAAIANALSLLSPEAVGELLANCGGKGGTPGPCKGEGGGPGSRGGKIETKGPGREKAAAVPGIEAAADKGATAKAPTSKGTADKAPVAVKIKAAEEKVKAVSAKVETAKGKLATLKGELKSAKANVASIKAEAKSKVAATPTKMDVKAKAAAGELNKISQDLVAKVVGKEKKGVVDVGAAEAKMTKAIGTTSLHKVAKELGLKTKFASKEKAMIAIRSKVLGPAASYVRAYA